jgi:hypothetical protein
MTRIPLKSKADVSRHMSPPSSRKKKHKKQREFEALLLNEIRTKNPLLCGFQNLISFKSVYFSFIIQPESLHEIHNINASTGFHFPTLFHDS